MLYLLFLLLTFQCSSTNLRDGYLCPPLNDRVKNMNLYEVKGSHEIPADKR